MAESSISRFQKTQLPNFHLVGGKLGIGGKLGMVLGMCFAIIE